MTLENENSNDTYEEHQDDPGFESFDIVLVDIQQAVTEKVIRCVKKRIHKRTRLKYVAISYRWGELEEVLVPTVDYNAHVKSFCVDDFLELCYAISREHDLRSMKYVWVDAICVNQMNDTERKETVYRMNEIYQYAKHIIAVPDLYLGHFKKRSLDMKVIHWIDDYAEYIYHVIMNNCGRVAELDNLWMENQLQVPKNLRCHLVKTVEAHHFHEQESYYFPDQEGIETRKEEREKTLFNKLVLSADEETTEQSTFNYVLDSCRRKLYLMSDILGAKTRQWQSQIDIWERAVNDRYQKLDLIFAFLKDRIQDWSERTWVISEYHIAKSRNNQSIKYWLISLNGYVSSLENDTIFSFFEINWKHDNNAYLTMDNFRRAQCYPVTWDNLRLGASFRDGIYATVNENSFLDMLLQSKASKDSDRFYAILPLSKEYGHHIKDKNTISTWRITNMISVRMRLRQWFTVEENLGLLYHDRRLLKGAETISLPSFDNERTFKAKSLAIVANDYFDPPFQGIYNYSMSQYNPGVKISDRYDESTTIENDTVPIQLRHSMHLYPKFYQVRSISFQGNNSYIFRDSTWRELQIDPTVDQLTWIRIPLLIPPEYYPTEHPAPRRRYPPQAPLELIGSSTKNVWIYIPLGFELLKYVCVSPSDEWIWRPRDDRGPGFHVF